MITIYLDHNIIDGFDKGQTAYLGPVFANKECLPIISVVSVDEIFRAIEALPDERTETDKPNLNHYASSLLHGIGNPTP